MNNPPGKTVTLSPEPQPLPQPSPWSRALDRGAGGTRRRTALLFPASPPELKPSPQRAPRGGRVSVVLLVLAGLALSTGLAMALDMVVHSAALAAWIYLLVVLPVTLRWGRGAGLSTAFVAGLLLLYLLVQPRFSLSVTNPLDLAHVGISVGGLVLAALLVDRANRGRIAAERRLAVRDERDRLQHIALAGIAHDLNQPLTSLLTGVQLLERRHEQLATERRAALLTDVRRAAERLRGLVADWLDLAREGGPPALALRPLDPAILLHAAVREHTGAFDGRISLDCPSDLPLIDGDVAALERVLDNLLGNAAKYGDGSVVLTARGEPPVVRFSVLDRGQGLSPEEIDRLFDPFYRSESTAARARGHGLGLAVASMLVQSHGGVIWAENRAGGGAAFHFTIPIATSNAPTSA